MSNKNNILAVVNLSTGEVHGDLKEKQKDNRFIRRGFKMYNQGIESIIENFTKGESLKIIRMFDSERVNRFNILNLPFKDYTEDMHTTDRSKFKKKLIENGVICEHNKLMMLNPYMFVPRGTKDIINCNYLTQQVWTYLFEDLNKDNEAIINHAKIIFGADVIRESTHIKVGNKKSEEQSKFVEKPKAELQ